MSTLNDLGTEILEINRANGWDVPSSSDWDELVSSTKDTLLDDALQVIYRYKIPTSLCLIHSEVSEALEEFRKDHRLDHFGEELVDVLIRTIELGAGLGIDLDAAMAAKLEKNRGRGHRHGGRLI